MIFWGWKDDKHSLFWKLCKKNVVCFCFSSFAYESPYIWLSDSKLKVDLSNRDTVDNCKVWNGVCCCCQFFVFFSELYAHYYLIQPQLFCDNISFNFKKKSE